MVSFQLPEPHSQSILCSQGGNSIILITPVSDSYASDKDTAPTEDTSVIGNDISVPHFKMAVFEMYPWGYKYPLTNQHFTANRELDVPFFLFKSEVNMSKPCKTRRSFKRIIQLLLVFIPIVVQLTELSSLHAQTSLGGPAPGLDRTSAATCYIASPGELTIRVNVWGYVRNPGVQYQARRISCSLWRMPSSVENGDISDVKITRIVNNNLLQATKDIFVHLQLRKP